MNWHLFDLAPTAWLLLLFVAVACLPLAWLARAVRGQSRPAKMAALAALLLTLVFELTVFGAFTRLTDSGLGCPDWPGCYGLATPLQAHAQISAAQAANPVGPVTHHKAWIEMTHRLFAGAVGFLLIVQWLLALRWRRVLPFSPWWALLSLVWVIGQGFFGALTVTMKLFPLIVSLHLLGALGLLALLQMQNTRWRLHLGRLRVVLVGTNLRVFAWVSAALLLLQIALGAWVSTNYAVVACMSWPLCQGQWLPPADYAQGFSLWRELHRNAAGGGISFDALVAIHLVHRWFALLAVLAAGVLAWRLRTLLPRSAAWLAALLLAQLATGLANVVLGWPLLAALLHTAGAAALLVVLVQVLLQLGRQKTD
ncbi:MAG: heme A synthase [Brachymonas sp.]|jgi:cytochrome c oxidase assembly protein subunit 15